jgi:hypothetical protein
MNWDCNMEFPAPGNGRTASNHSVGKCNGAGDEQQVVFERLQINEAVPT